MLLRIRAIFWWCTPTQTPIEGADQIVSKLTGSPARYPVVLYLGTEARNVSGKIADGVMTGLVNGNLSR